MHLVGRVALLFALAVLIGCQSGTAKSRFGERAVVKGKVTLGGKALTKGLVVYTPIDEPTKGEETGQLGPNGEYITSVFPGKYKVSFSESPSVPTKYRSPQTSDFEIEISSGGKEDANFDLK